MRKQVTKGVWLIAALALAGGVVALSEPNYQGVTPSQTVGSIEFPLWTKSVTVISAAGSATCYLRLFTDIDTAGNATTASMPLAANESLGFTLLLCESTTSSPTCRDSETISRQTGAKATRYSSMSYICSTGQTATWRVIAK